jgi:hypothetical protein
MAIRLVKRCVVVLRAPAPVLEIVETFRFFHDQTCVGGGVGDRSGQRRHLHREAFPELALLSAVLLYVLVFTKRLCG